MTADCLQERGDREHPTLCRQLELPDFTRDKGRKFSGEVAEAH